MSFINTLKFILKHPLNRGRPIRTLARYASWQVRSRLRQEVEVDWIEGTKLVARNGMTGATGNIYCGLHEYRDMAFILHALRLGDLFVDVGANIGSYTILASGVCGAQSVSIEPDAGTLQHLERNVSANGIGELVDLHLTAVGERSGSISFTRGKDTMNRVASPNDTDVQTVPLARLDDILRGRKPTIIKFDIEGYETPALRGAHEILARPSLNAVILETVDPETLFLLKEYGFTRMSYTPEIRMLTEETGEDDSSNVLFVRGLDALVAKLKSAPERTVLGRAI
jgi:FkbM family methyltransferase